MITKLLNKRKVIETVKASASLKVMRLTKIAEGSISDRETSKDLD